jgi:hypothetical protein
METNFKSTSQVAKILGIGVSALQRALWTGRVKAPLKSPQGGFLWMDSDINSASWVLRRKAYDPEKEGKNE